MKVATKVLALEPTVMCTLRCRLCALGVPYLKAKDHESFEVVLKEIKRIFEIFDYAERIDVAGGEPLMHPDLAAIIAELLKYRDHYGSIRIVTNCTIMPKEDLWRVMMANRDTVDFLLDDYGEHSPQYKDIARMCEERNIIYKHNIYHGDEQYCGGWIDFGGWDDRHYSEEKLWAVYRKCHTSENPCITIYGGAAYFCARSMLGELLGRYQNDNTEKIDLLDEALDLKQLRDVAAHFGHKPPTGCRFCDGFDVDAKRYPAAEQLPKNI